MNKFEIEAPSQPRPAESFDDRIGILSDELELAIKWNRPSILLVVYSSESIRSKAEVALAAKLRKLKQAVTNYRVTDATSDDIPLYLSQLPNKDSTVFFVSGLQSDNGVDGRNAYRALNIRREYFVDHHIRAVFWLTEEEASALPKHAPDFWAFRHRVVEFVEASKPKSGSSMQQKLQRPDFENRRPFPVRQLMSFGFGLLMLLLLIQFSPHVYDFFKSQILKVILSSRAWKLEPILVISSLAAVTSVVFALWRLWQQRRTQRLLEKSFGSELYGPEIIERSMRYYIPPDCSSVDPAQEAEIRQVKVTKQKLFAMVDIHLTEDSANRHLLLLADSGMGKSSFVLNYYARNQLLSKRKRNRLAVVPLGIPDADEYIAKIPDPNNTVLFLDGFDEDTRAIKDHRQRLQQLMYVCRHFKRVLMTCRTQFFTRDEEIPRETGIVRVGPPKVGEGRTYEFWKLYLSPLSDEQVQAYWRKRYRWSRHKRKQATEFVNKIPSLSTRPMLLAYIPDLLESGAKIKYAFQLYKILVEKWLERESHWVKIDDLRQFSERLAIALYINRRRRGTERIPRAELNVLAKEWNIPLDEWQLSGRSLLNRDAEGNYKFAHRSIMEYLVVKRFVDGDPACYDIDWTDQMKVLLWEIIHHHVAAKKPITFDVKKADLSGLQLSLRPVPVASLTDEVVRLMLKREGFFDRSWHGNGTGIRHLYELAERKGVNLVADYATGLTWQQSGSSDSIAFYDAEKYVRELNYRKYGGYSNWRLPTLEEVMSLMEPNKRGDLYLDSIFDRQQHAIWVADKYNRDEAWSVHFALGVCSHSHVNNKNSVRAVR